MSAGQTLVVVNPASGDRRAAHHAGQLERHLADAGRQPTMAVTSGPGDATRLVRSFVREGGRSVVAVGGDGTINEVVAGCVLPDGSAMEAPDITLAIVHQGTGGDLARGVGIPKRFDEACAVAAADRVRTVDVGVARFCDHAGQPAARAWISCCNVGLGADVVRMHTGAIRRLGDTASYAVASLACLLRNRRRSVTVTLDGDQHELDIVDVMVANNTHVGGGMYVAPHARIDDGLVDVVIVTAARRLRLVTSFPRIYRGTHLADPIVRWRQVREVSVKARGEQQGVVLDGELVGTTPASFRVLPSALALRVPSTRPDGQGDRPGGA